MSKHNVYSDFSLAKIVLIAFQEYIIILSLGLEESNVYTVWADICCLCGSADSDHTWKIAHVPMEVGVKFRYAFQAVRGDPSASTGGIYIDDVSLTETRCPNAVWRIQNFSKIMETATSETVLYSPRFYSPEGYGYGVRVLPLSTYTDYTGNYTGLYFHLASGENDAVLQWPAINRQATLVVMDQDPDIKLRMSTARSLTTDMRSEFLLSKKEKKITALHRH